MISGEDLTVVIPTYRRPQFLAQALESVLAQNVSGLCLRVFDNASGDETAAVVAAASRRHPIEYVCQPENLGAAGNIKSALGSVRTRYCVLLGDDDLQAPAFLTTALARLDEHKSAAAFCGRTLIYDETARRAYRVQGSSWPRGFYRAGTKTRQMVDEHFTFTGVVFRSDVFGVLPFSGGDMEFLAMIAERYDFVVGENVTAVWRIHPGSWSRHHPIAEEQRAAVERLRSYFSLTTLGADDRFALFSRTLRELAHKSFHQALDGVVGGERDATLFVELGRAARLLQGLAPDTTSTPDWAQRLLVAGTAVLASRGPATGGLIHLLAATTSRLSRRSSAAVAPAEDSGGELIGFIEEMERRAAQLLTELK